MSEAVQENSTSASSFVFPSLKSLYIKSCGIAGRWLTQMLPRLQSLEKLVLNNCPQIKLLSISQPTETEGTSSSASADTSVMSSGQDEQLLKMPYNILLSLKHLSISDCPDMEFCGGKGSFEGFTYLLVLAIRRCPKLVSSLVGETKGDGSVDIGLLPPPLQDLQISRLPAILQSYVPEGLLHLKKLRLSRSPYLKSVQLHSFTSLEDLQIMGCKHLAALEGLQFLCSLRSLKIEMNPELSSAWDLKAQEEEQGGNQIRLFPPLLNKLDIWNITDHVQSRLLSCLPPNMELAICRSPELTSLQLGYCTALKELEIRHCVSLVSIEGFQSTRNLTSLKLSDSPSLPPCLELESHQEGVSEIWSRLETLEIDDSSVLSISLCKQLTSLRRLEFMSWGSTHTEGMVSLAEEQERGFQLLISLKELRLVDCPNLLSLPANLCSLTSLDGLYPGLSKHHKAARDGPPTFA